MCKYLIFPLSIVRTGDIVRTPPGAKNPAGNGFYVKETPLLTGKHHQLEKSLIFPPHNIHNNLTLMLDHASLSNLLSYIVFSFNNKNKSTPLANRV
jgi:hypothetical protein